MITQRIFDYEFFKKEKIQNFYINDTNTDAFHGVTINPNKYIYLKGLSKSGKSYIANIWLKNNKAVRFNNNFDYLINDKKNVLIEDIHLKIDEEKCFHLINHCKLNSLNILITSNNEINDLNFSLQDLISRLKTFNYFKIYNPDDDMLLNILLKLFIDRQFIINSNDIFQYILKNANRSYLDMYNIVEKLDSLSLEKKRQLTIPLIKEIL